MLIDSAHTLDQSSGGKIPNTTIASRRRLAGSAEARTPPRPPGAEKLSGAKDKYPSRQGDYRILLEIQDGVLVVYIVKAGHRREVHRQLPE